MAGINGHTCLSDDGGTPNRRCDGCIEEARTAPRLEAWITTYTGRKVNPLDLKVEDICIDDIAHHSALINRFCGSTKKPVTLAQHDVYVSRLLDGTGWEMEGLFHDAPEAYLGDVTKWVKRMPEMKAYREADLRAWRIICEALGIRVAGDPDVNSIVRRADDLMVRFEAMHQQRNPEHLFAVPTHPRPTQFEIDEVGAWKPWTWQAAERGFWDRYRQLGGTVQPLPRKRA